MDSNEIPFLPATELSVLIKSREVSPVQAAQAYLDRIGQVDEKLNSYITVCRDEALAEARQAEQEISAGNYRGPMHGLPVAVKDQFYTEGIRTTGGSRRGRHRGSQSQGCRLSDAWETEHERIRLWRCLPSSLRHSS